VTFLQIKRLTGRQAAIGRGPGGQAPPAAAPGAVPVALAPQPSTVPLPVSGAAPDPAWAPVPGPPWEVAGRPGRGAGGAARPVPGPALPDVTEVLDEAFGERRE
jgi:hypothetical protein